jgi:membrane protease YdiL (CAAX protease family)
MAAAAVRQSRSFMDPRPYFLLPDGRLRAGWRLIAFLLILSIVGVATSSFGAVVLERSHGNAPFAVPVMGVTAVLLATWIAMRLVDRRSLRDVGLALDLAAARSVVVGCCFGVVLGGSVCGLERLFGLITFEPSGPSGIFRMSTAAGVMVLLIPAAAFEELLFRGYPFQAVIQGTNVAVATALFSIGFGLVHIINPNATALSTINTVLAGVLLSLCYLTTRNLWYPIGWHFAWNATLAFSGIPVSGMDLARMPWQAVAASDQVWLFGGDYGPEGGVIATAALLLGIAWLVRKFLDEGAAAQHVPAAEE